MDCSRPSPRSDARPRLHKVLAAAGFGSRRACEGLIADGRVAVDGAVIREQGLRVDPARQDIRVDGRRAAAQAPVYLLLNKPRDVLCTARDPRGRRTVFALLPSLEQRVFTVGRLDRYSEGLLVITNDGALAQTLAHPRHGIEKRYRVWTPAPLSAAQQARLLAGVPSEGERLRLRGLAPVPAAGADGRGCCEVRLAEGRNRHIRRMFEALGIPIRRLQRVALGPLTLGGLRSGAWRRLNEGEVAALRAAAAPAQPTGA